MLITPFTIKILFALLVIAVTLSLYYNYNKGSSSSSDISFENAFSSNDGPDTNTGAGSARQSEGGSARQSEGGSARQSEGGSPTLKIVEDESFKEFKTTYPANNSSIYTTCNDSITETGMKEKQSCLGVTKILEGLSEKSNYVDAQTWIQNITEDNGSPTKVCTTQMTHSPIEQVCKGITGTMRDAFGVEGGTTTGNPPVNSLQQVCTNFSMGKYQLDSNGNPIYDPSTSNWGECSRKCKLYMDPGANGSKKYKHLCDNACKVVLKSLCNHDFSVPPRSIVKILIRNTTDAQSGGVQPFEFRTVEGELIVSVEGNELSNSKRVNQQPIIKTTNKMSNFPDTIILSSQNHDGITLSSFQIDDVYYGSSTSNKEITIDPGNEGDAGWPNNLTVMGITLYKIV